MYILFEYDYFFDQLTGFFIRVSTINEYICFTTLYYFQWQNKKFQGSSATHFLFVSLSDHYSILILLLQMNMGIMLKMIVARQVPIDDEEMINSFDQERI